MARTTGSKHPPAAANAAQWRDAILLGVAGGMRTFAPTAALTLRGRILNNPARYALLTAAAGELAGDKHPAVPPRYMPQGLAGRLVNSAWAGNVVGGRQGAAVAAATAGASTVGTYYARKALGDRTELPDPVLGTIEDVLAGALAALATRKQKAPEAEEEVEEGADPRPAPLSGASVDEPTQPTALVAIGRGLVAGAVGTAAMTAAQMAYYSATDKELSVAPGEVAKRIIEGVFDRKVPRGQEERLNWGMHLVYGTTMGVPFGIAAGSLGRRPGVLNAGVAFAGGVWGHSLVVLPAMGLSPPVWKLPPSSITSEVVFHLVYGIAGSAAYRALP